MHSRDGDPVSKPDIGIDTAAERRRPSRLAQVSPQLVALLRGQIDPDAPADPVLHLPGRFARRDVVLGSAIIAALVFTGVLVRFAI